MKRKIQKIIICIGFLTALSLAAIFTACDMVRIEDPALTDGSRSGSKELSEKERDELEKTGHFLKLVNMPLNTQTPNVFSVSVANSASPIGKLNKDNLIYIYKETDTCTVYLPLVYNDDAEFWETGFFYTAFTIHVDAVTKYIVDVSDRFLVSYTDGRGTANVNNLPTSSAPILDPRYLTVFNLPASTSIHNFSKVAVHNQAGAVAKCNEYSQIVLSVNDNLAVAKIPLHYNSVDQIFSETGVFYVVFDINVDAETRYTVVLDDQVKVTFINGNGYLDILNIPDKPVPYLTIKELPLNATKYHLSNVDISNLAESVAGCSNYKNIIVLKDKDFLTFLIPLSSSNGGYFQDSGRFAVTFTFNIDIDTQFIYEKKDNLILPFTNGSAEFSILSFYGAFEASLLNPNDTTKPVIKAGSLFDINGNRITVQSNTQIDTLTPNSSCFMYLYAYVADSDVFYEFSTTAPTYNSKRRGWYNGARRALWKMIYIKSSNSFILKTSMKEGEDAFPHFGMHGLSITDHADYNQLTESKLKVKVIYGGSNPPAQTISLDPGVYVIELVGAAGGIGRAFNGTGGAGGHGGCVREILTLNSKTDFTAFTGSAGAHAPAAPTHNNFGIVTTKNYYAYTVQNVLHGYTTTPEIVSNSFIQSDTVFPTVGVYGVHDLMSGGGGGGGGSGTFLYSPGANYLLIAGGGGGGSGGSYLTPGGGGGSGGTIGPGAGGGGSGSLSQSSPVGTSNWSSPGGLGGAGGGYNGGKAGSVANSGGSAETVLSSNSYLAGGAGTASYNAASLTTFYYSFTLFDTTLSLPCIPTLYVTSTGPIAAASQRSQTTSNKLVSVRTMFSVSGNSGSGGSVSVTSYPPGPQEWLNTIGIGGQGASSLPLSAVSINGSLSSTVSEPGRYNSDWNYYNDKYNSTISWTLGEPQPAQPGGHGGNNRNSTRGYGTMNGEGSIVIHKIY
jgi:hypothetical protein